MRKTCAYETVGTPGVSSQPGRRGTSLPTAATEQLGYESRFLAMTYQSQTSS